MSDFSHLTDLNPLYNDFYGEFLLDGGGEFIYDRFNVQEGSTSAMTTGRLNLMGFKCKRTETISKCFANVGGSASVGGTIRRFGLYLRSKDQLSYNLVASTANDLTIFTVANSEYLRSFSASYQKIRGEEYLFGFLAVGGTMPTLQGPMSLGGVGQTPIAQRKLNPPVRLAQLDSQTDLPASFLVSSLTNTVPVITTCCALLP